jgi:hypothetical protein
LSGVGGAYYLPTSSNLLVPLSLGTSMATNHFDSTGHFIFTNAAQTSAPPQFYLLQLP